MNRGNCPAPDLLIQLSLGQLDPGAELRLSAHLDSCTHCQETLADLDPFSGTETSADPLASRISRLGQNGLPLAISEDVIRRIASLSANPGLVSSPAQSDIVPTFSVDSDVPSINSRDGQQSAFGAAMVFMVCLALTAGLVFSAFFIDRSQWGRREVAVSDDSINTDSKEVPSMANTRRRKKQADLRANQVQVVEPRVMLAATMYVDSGFTGTSSGSATNPYKKIQDAVDQINLLETQAQAAGSAVGSVAYGSVINIKAGNGTTTGIYRETVDLSGLTNLNGTSTNPIVFQKWGTGTVTIKGTELLGTSADDFTSVTPYATQMYKTTAMNWTQGIGRDQIFVDDQMLNWARLNNNPGSSPLVSASSAGWSQLLDSTKVVDNADGSSDFDVVIGGEGGQYYVGSYMHLVPGDGYVSQSGQIIGSTARTDGNSTVRIRIMQNSAGYWPKTGNKFYIVGGLNLLTDNGEWFRNKDTGILYLKTPAGGDPDNYRVEAKKRDIAINASGRQYITFNGINVFGANVVANNGVGLKFQNMTILYPSHYDLVTTGPWQATWAPGTTGPADQRRPGGNWNGDYGPWIFGTSDTGVVLRGNFNTVENCTIKYSAGNGITLSGVGNRIINNLISDVNYMGTNAAAIFAGVQDVVNGSYVFSYAERCEIAYNTLTRSGRSLLVTSHLRGSSIHHNDISYALLVSVDAGAISSGGVIRSGPQLGQGYANGMGTVIAYNKVHDVYANGASTDSHISAGIYLDEGSHNYIIHHNLVWNTKRALQISMSLTDQNHRIYQNTLIGDQQSIEAYISSGSRNLNYTEIINNILVGTIGGHILAERIAPGTTMKMSNNKEFQISRSAWSGNAELQAMFINLANFDLRLKAGSTAINFGTVITPYSVAAGPDAGAIEWAATAVAFTAGQNVVQNNDMNSVSIGLSGSTRMYANQFDTLGSEVSYYDSDIINSRADTHYRSSEGVDSAPYNIGYVNGGEWVEYTVDAPVAGTYIFTFTYDSIATAGFTYGSGNYIQIEAFREEGSTLISLATADLINSGTTATATKGIFLKGGKQTLRLKFKAIGTHASINFSYFDITNPQQAFGVLNGSQQAVSGSPKVVAATGSTTVEAEQFDLGGEGVAYHDDTIHSGGSYRSNEMVDAGTTTYIPGSIGGAIGWIFSGEWAEYTVDIQSSGTYQIGFRVSSTQAIPNGYTLLVQGNSATAFTTLCNVSIPNTGSQATFNTVNIADVPLSAGKYVLRVTFNVGSSGNVSNLDQIIFTKTSALEAESTGANTSAPALTLQQAAPIFAEAKRRWQNLGVKASAFNGVTFSIADLPNNTLAVSSGKSITIDSNAANWGWFIDPTPGNDREFTLAGNQGEQNRMDLLTTVTHELGHVLGLEHAANGVMEETLSAGERDMPSASDFVAVTSGGGTSTVRRTHAISETAGVPVAATSPVETLRRPWWWG